MMMTCWVLLEVLISSVMAMWHESVHACVPLPAAGLFGFLSVKGFELPA